MVKIYESGEAFGELALLYNCTRQASIKATEDCVLFALDRETFNHIVKDAAVKRRQHFENFLSKVELLETLTDYERTQIADVLKSQDFKKGDCVIREGDIGDCFYFIETG